MKSDWEYFTKEELACRGSCANCTCSDKNMNKEFMEKLVKLRELCGFPFPITSGYRCKDYNTKVTKNPHSKSAHMSGKAVDIQIAGENAFILVAMALRSGFSGIGIKQKGKYTDRFIHLDYGTDHLPRPRIWSY